MALDEEHGQVPHSIAMSLCYGLGGAILADLFAARRIRLDASARYWIKHRLREITFTAQAASECDVALISLVRASNLLDHIFTRDELKLARKKVDMISKNEQFGQSVIEAIQAMEAATVTAALVAATG